MKAPVAVSPNQLELVVLGAQGIEGERVSDVEEAPLELLSGSWTVRGSGAWRSQEPIVVLEGRSMVFALKALTRNTKVYGHPVLVLSDSLSIVLAQSKGRSSTAGVGRICR